MYKRKICLGVHIKNNNKKKNKKKKKKTNAMKKNVIKVRI